jgi:hypothetical protein
MTCGRRKLPRSWIREPSERTPAMAKDVKHFQKFEMYKESIVA